MIKRIESGTVMPLCVDVSTRTGKPIRARL